MALLRMSPDTVHPLEAMMTPITADPMEQYERMQAAQPMAPPANQGLGGENEPGHVVQMSPLDPYEEALRTKQMSDIRKDQNPYGSADNHPGVLGRILHGLSVATGGPNRRQFAEEGREKQIAGIESEKSKNALEGAQAANLGATQGKTEEETREMPGKTASEEALQGATKGNLESETRLREHPLPAYQNVPGMLTPEGKPVNFETHTGEYTPGNVEGLRYGRAIDKFQHVAGTLNGQPFQAAFDPINHTFVDPDTGEQITGFKPQPQVGMQGPIVVSPAGDVVRATPGKTLPEGFRTVSQGGSLNIPTSQMRNMGEMAETVVPMANNVRNEVQQLAQQVGPAAGRWNQLMVNKGGADFPEFAGLDTDLDLLASAIVRTHFGARGGQQYREELRRMFGEAQSPEDLISRIDHADSWLKGYAQAGGVKPQAGAGGTEPQRPANVPAGYTFNAHGPKGAGWYAPAAK